MATLWPLLQPAPAVDYGVLTFSHPSRAAAFRDSPLPCPPHALQKPSTVDTTHAGLEDAYQQQRVVGCLEGAAEGFKKLDEHPGYKMAHDAAKEVAKPRGRMPGRDPQHGTAQDV